MARRVVDSYGGEIPSSLEEMITLAGVARKTANVVLGTAYGLTTGVVVDTHVKRLAQRLGLTQHSNPVRVENDLMRLIPRDQWIDFGHRIIWHGRRVCHARTPDCENCPLVPLCPSSNP
jgi:endonuclease-3